MKMTKMFGRTLREKPAETELASHELMLRAALVSRLAAGLFSYLPMAWKSVKKITNILREEIDAVGGQEINMPVVNPADHWQETGRWYSIGPEMVRFKDRSGHDMCLAMTHEETVTDIARKYIDSYRQLPVVLYHIQTKFRDEPRSRGGLIRVREFTMKDAYSFHTDSEDIERYYPLMCKAYKNICKRCGVPVSMVLSDVGMMGGTMAHEFMHITDLGEDTVIICQECSYAANREVARLSKSSTFTRGKEASPMEKIATPGMDTIPLVSGYLDIDPREIIKTMAYFAGDELVFVVIRGDLEVNERKLANALKVNEVKAATEEELKENGLVQGYMSPVGLRDIRIIADDSVLVGYSYVAGANQEGYHLKNVVPGRDFTHGLICEISKARENDPCPMCGSPLVVKRGIEVGNTFVLGTKYSESMGAYYKTEDGNRKPIVMGCYGMGVGRLQAVLSKLIMMKKASFGL